MDRPPSSSSLASAGEPAPVLGSYSEQDILEALFVTDPQKDLLKARNRARHGRVEGSCQWILDRPEYAAWRDHASPQLLMVVGEAGIGKTAMATFLVEKLTSEAASEGLTFAYFFCSHSEPQRSTAIFVLKGLLHQILIRRPQLVDHAQRTLDVHGAGGFDDFEVLWFLFVRVVQDPRVGQLTLLIDSLDNCDVTLRKILVRRLEELLRTTLSTERRHWRLLILTRPQAWDLGTCRRLVSGWTELEWMVVITMSPIVIDSDLRKLIADEVYHVAAVRHWTEDTRRAVKLQLEASNGGTFLWISLALRCVADTKEDFILRRLKRYTGSLRDLYVRILRKIDTEDADLAECTLHYVLGASRPLTLTELAIALYYRDSQNRTGQLLPNDAQIDDIKAAMRCCELLLRVNGRGQHATVELVHQSVADFLVEHNMPLLLRRYKTTVAKAAERLSMACAAYLCSPELKSFAVDIRRLVRQGRSQAYSQTTSSRDSMLERQVSNGDSSAFSRAPSDVWSTVSYLPMSTKQMALLQYATSTWAVTGSWKQIRTLPIHAIELVKLHGRPRDLIFETAKIAISEGHDLAFRHLIKLLLRRLSLDDGLHLFQSTIHYDECGAEPAIGSKEREYWTEELPDAEAIYHELKRRWNNLIPEAASMGLVDVVKFCIQQDDDIVLKDVNGLTALHMAARAGHLAVVKVLTHADRSKSNLKDQDRHGQTPLHHALNSAAQADNFDVVKALVKSDHRKASLHVRDIKGETPLHRAVKMGRLAFISMLLSADRNRLAIYIPEYVHGRLPVHSAVFTGCVEVVRLLAAADVGGRTLIARDKDGKTALDLAVELQGEGKREGYVDQRTLIVDFLHRESMLLLFGEAVGKTEKGKEMELREIGVGKTTGGRTIRNRPITVAVRGRSCSL